MLAQGMRLPQTDPPRELHTEQVRQTARPQDDRDVPLCAYPISKRTYMLVSRGTTRVKRGYCRETYVHLGKIEILTIIDTFGVSRIMNWKSASPHYYFGTFLLSTIQVRNPYTLFRESTVLRSMYRAIDACFHGKAKNTF